MKEPVRVSINLLGSHTDKRGKVTHPFLCCKSRYMERTHLQQLWESGNTESIRTALADLLAEYHATDVEICIPGYVLTPQQRYTVFIKTWEENRGKKKGGSHE